jgi:hypothetical protein
MSKNNGSTFAPKIKSLSTVKRKEWVLVFAWSKVFRKNNGKIWVEN